MLSDLTNPTTSDFVTAYFIVLYVVHCVSPFFQHVLGSQCGPFIILWQDLILTLDLYGLHCEKRFEMCVITNDKSLTILRQPCAVDKTLKSYN